MPTRKHLIATLILALALPPAHADEDQIVAWTRQQGACDQALDAGQYREAEAACKSAVGLGETLEPGLFFDTSLNSVALAYLRQRRYPEAEITLKKLLETRSAAFGPEHPLTTSGMNLLAAVYRKSGREAEAKQLEAQFRRIEETCGGLLDDDAKEDIAKGAAVNPCNPLPVPDFLRQP